MDRLKISDRHIILLALALLVLPAAAVTENGTAGLGAQAGAPPYEIRTFTPHAGSIHSDQINDAVNGKGGAVLFATSFGLSTFNGTWSTRHVTRDNVSEGLIDDFVTAIEYDHLGNLWIGYAGGLQIYNGRTYLTIRDQQLLKDLRIKAIQRWGDTIWVATGNAGMHRYWNGTWTWFQPMSKGGPGFYEVDSMALDPESDTLLIATVHDGIWSVPSSSDPVTFRRIDTPGDQPPSLEHVRKNPLGGAYFFDDKTITRYSEASGRVPVLTIADLTQEQAGINDIAAEPGGTLYLGTDDGIVIWKDGSVFRHLGRFEGIGSSPNVRWVFADAAGRLWFATSGSVGYYTAGDTLAPVVTIQVINPVSSTEVTTEPTPVITVTTTQTITVPTRATGNEKEPSLLERLSAIVSGILSAFRR